MIISLEHNRVFSFHIPDTEYTIHMECFYNEETLAFETDISCYLSKRKNNIRLYLYRICNPAENNVSMEDALRLVLWNNLSNYIAEYEKNM
ncbi:MAG: hypothetical protein H6Q60_827 [Oscillospiraceae bacterium]|nr:hypothetical protein [Oscillospiraceae bacterium]